MRPTQVGDVTVEFAERGTGDPILLAHAGLFSEWFAPLAAGPYLDAFRVITLRRAGYVPASRPERHLTIGDHAAHCASLLEELGIDRAHFCGHSSSALIGLQLALDRPDLVQSLILLEPAPGGELNGPKAQAAVPEAVGAAMAAFASGDTATGFDRFMLAVGRVDHRAVLKNALGAEGIERAIEESAYFPDEASAVMEWRFGAAEAAAIVAPTLVVEGSETARLATIPPESVGVLAGLIPHAERAVLDGASHLMPLEDPAGVAQLISGFARKHPIRPS